MSAHSEKKAELIINPNEVITNAKEKELVKKIDLRIIPLVMILNILSFLDRVNIGNAKLANLEHDLNLIVAFYFHGLCLFIDSILTTSWGSVVIAMAFVKNYSQLMATRFLLGVFEAGLYSGIIFYLTKWYKKSERSYRISFFVAGGVMAGAFNGLVAFSISSLNGKFGLNGWQWIFLTEGVITVIVAFFCYFLISDYAETAIWLTDDERKLAIERLQLDMGHTYATHLDKHQIILAFKDLKVYIFMFINSCLLVTMYSFSFFIPTIVNGMGFDSVISQLLSTPPFIIGCISSLLIAKLSDNYRIRSPYLIFGLLISIIGYSFLIIHNASVACDSKRAVGCAMVIAWGNLGGVLSSQIYRPSDAPAYITGHIIALSLLIFAVILSIIQYSYLNSMNKYKLKDPKRFLKGSNVDDTTHLGDLHPSFIYTL
ncbi:4483_t:CDS:2 [Cetraspora pellucida]|uniref:4483_t:CDS:1 n=1 Tax=Cetraspora pellucida TaxID=1433469 RepID=A0ACA9KA30_9GLOM|nr:4483_t:CDS:2 [Cetraspora pellucida]